MKILTYKTNRSKCLFFTLENTEHEYKSVYDFVKKNCQMVIYFNTSWNLSVNRNYSGGPVKARDEVRAAARHQSCGCVASQSHRECRRTSLSAVGGGRVWVTWLLAILLKPQDSPHWLGQGQWLQVQPSTWYVSSLVSILSVK